MSLIIGSKNDELKRDKIRQKTSNEEIFAFKSNKSFKNNNSELNTAHEIAKALLHLPSKSLSLNSSMDTIGINNKSAKKHIIALKYIIKNFKLTRFEINSSSNIKFANVSNDLLVNSKSDNNLQRKITKLLDQRKHKDEIIIPPTEYYDDNLNLVVEAKNYRMILPKVLSNSVNFQ